MEEDPYNKLIEFLAPYPEELQKLVLDGRLFLLEDLQPVNEIFYDACSAVCAGFMYTDKVRDCFCNFATYPKHVTLIFGFGATLPDPEERLKGGGNQVRHLRLQDLSTLQDPYVLNLVRQAAAQAPKPPELMEPMTIVKVMQGKKRR